jgi:hypothetical protein
MVGGKERPKDAPVTITTAHPRAEQTAQAAEA